MSDFNGWKKLDKVSIVYSTDDSIEYKDVEYPKAYIVETGNKKSLQSAINWARSWNYETKKYDLPEIIDTDNKDFSFQIISAASGSWQGGKLSFWMCLMSNENVKPFMVGINSELLCDLILESSITNGAIKEKVFFARKNSQLGVLHETMPSYQTLLNDEQLKKNMSKNKTTKWKIGYLYKTITTQDVMLGTFSKIVTFTYNDGRTYYTRDNKLNINLDFNQPDHVAYTYVFDEDSFSINKAYDELISNLSYRSDGLRPKCPSRQEGKKLFKETPTYYTDFIKRLTHSEIDRNFKYEINKAFAIYKYDKNATITILKNAKDYYDQHFKELYAQPGVPEWINVVNHYGNNCFETMVSNRIKQLKIFGKYKSEEEVRNSLKNDLLNNYFYYNDQPISIIYNGNTFTFDNWSLVFDKLIDIASNEK